MEFWCFPILLTLTVVSLAWSSEDIQGYPDDDLLETYMESESYRQSSCILVGDPCEGTCDCCGWTTTCRHSKTAGEKICKEGSKIKGLNTIMKGVGAAKKANCVRKHYSG
uniref:U61-Liphistoxin-Lsp1a_1 n=2 Tax=Liphistius TaxID=62150 RepID=A0A4Q8K3H6_9ARAC